MSREAVVQAANDAVGTPGDASLPFACLRAGGIVPPKSLSALRTIGWPEAGELRSKDNVPLPGDIAHFDESSPGIIVAIDETHVTVVVADGGTVIDIALIREDVGAIYSIRSLLEPRGTDELEQASLILRLRSGETAEDLRADGFSAGDVTRAVEATVAPPTDEERLAAERASLKTSVRAEAEARLSQIRRSKVREELHTEVVAEMLVAGDITEDERAVLDPPTRAGAQAAALEAAQLKGGSRG